MNLGFVRNSNYLGNVCYAIFKLGLYGDAHCLEHVQIATEQFDYCQIATLIRIYQFVQVCHYGFGVNEKF